MTDSNLTPLLTLAELERLAMLAEEASEVIQAASLLMSDGPDGRSDPLSEDHNSLALRREITDFMAISFLMRNDLIPEDQLVIDLKEFPAGPHFEVPIGDVTVQFSRVIKQVMKTIRKGYESCHPMYPEWGDNRTMLSLAIVEANATVASLNLSPDLPAIIAKKMKHTVHQDANTDCEGGGLSLT